LEDCVISNAAILPLVVMYGGSYSKVAVLENFMGIFMTLCVAFEPLTKRQKRKQLPIPVI